MELLIEDVKEKKSELTEVKNILMTIKFPAAAQQSYTEPTSSSSSFVLAPPSQRSPTCRQLVRSSQELFETSMYGVVPSPPPLPPPLQPSMPSNQGTSVLPATLQPSVSTAPTIEKSTEDFSTTFLVDMKTQSSSRPNFAARLVRSLYSIDERKISNVRGVLGKKRLSPRRLGRIKNATFQMYPCVSGENETATWTACCKAVDETCRRLNRKGKENTAP